MDQYLALVVMAVLAVGFVVLSITTARMLATNRPTAAKEAPYESGIVPTREPPERFPVRFYLVAMIFIIFDIEIIFLYPWAVVFRRLGPFGLWEMLVFAAAVFVSFVYLIGRGALNWGPAKQTTPEHPSYEAGAPGPSGARSSERSTESTIRRVGGTGRVPVRAGAGEGGEVG